MGPELALGFPAMGAVAAAVLRRNRTVAYATGVLLGLAGLAATMVALPAQLPSPAVLPGSIPASSRVLLVASAASLGLILALAPAQVDRLWLLVAGLAGLAGLAAVAAAPDALLLALALLLVAAGQASLPGRRPLPARLQGAALAALLLTVGYTLAQFSRAPDVAPVAGLAIALGLVAGLGLIPLLHQLEPAEAMLASPLAWLGFLGPVVAVSFTEKAAIGLGPGAGAVYGAVLIGLGLVNLVWGSLGAWWTRDDVGAWRYSFLADWGLVLVGLGLFAPEGSQAAFLLLLALLLVRLPLYLGARPVALRRAEPATDPLNVVLIALLAGVAPFAGFGARLLLLKAATQMAWPLAALLALGMLLFTAHSVRLARTLGRPRGRAALGVWAAVILSLVIGLLPAPFLAAAGH